MRKVWKTKPCVLNPTLLCTKCIVSSLSHPKTQNNRIMKQWGGCNPKKTEKNRKKPKKTSPKFEICGSVRFFSVFFGIFRLFSVFFGFFRYFSGFFGFLWYFFGFFRSELRQEIPVIQKSCQQ